MAWRRGLAWLVVALLVLLAGVARADGVELRGIEVGRNDDGLVIGFSAAFELPRSVEDALMKGVPLHFVAEASTWRSRWYWRDQRIARQSRTWRLAYQPLTRRYRVTFGSLNQQYESLGDALAAIQRVSRWKIADGSQLERGERHYIELAFRLDTTQLPRPFQIGIGGQAEWNLSAESTVVIEDPT
ncbi:DUF4390 domain-containing protein [Aquabacterium sp. A7-Y]|uniref:DUF4390 domain-containing protein n=1 Tax=Aquabacterium sp. A7-Y TaxID=1349605 RepID=UPI00223CA826|nr:DUF4390 domain-containing protein [Aquabacterium sp. A7-Y]MCW7536686.1 DUF4390 domain-containing protein [Aquabacterium sp. A7-Y]